MLIFIENRVLFTCNSSKESLSKRVDHTFALLLLVLSFLFNERVKLLQNWDAFEFIRLFGNVMRNQLNGVAFGALSQGLSPHDPLGNEEDFIDKLNIELEGVFLDIKSVNNGCESFRKIVEIDVIQLAVNRVHFRHLKVYYLNKVVTIGHQR